MQIINPALGGESGSWTRNKLDGVEYRIQVQWIPESPTIPRFDESNPPPPLELDEPGEWSLTLAQGDGTVLIAGQVLRHGVNVCAGYRGDDRFPGRGLGRLLVWDQSGQGRDPGRDDLDPGSPVQLVYLGPDE